MRCVYNHTQRICFCICIECLAVERLDAFLAHWRSIPRAGHLPTLRDYLDRPQPELQPWTMILDVEATSLPVRLLGTGLTALLGFDGTGFDYVMAVREPRRAQVLARDRQCTTQPCGLRLGMHAVTQSQRTFINTVLVLPVLRAPDSYSLIRVSDFGGFVDDSVGGQAVSISHYTTADWVDLGAGVPAAPPWSEGAA
jgi:hypothetical protein